jgi:hypothetical protein
MAMHRTAAALRNYAPAGVKVVPSLGDAPDLQVLHSIGPHVEANLQAPEYAVIQYCFRSARYDEHRDHFRDVWSRARAVWSYYDLRDEMPKGATFYHAPLGVDGRTFRGNGSDPRYVGVVSSGYVNGDRAEAIEEVAEAALRSGLSVFHLGPPSIENMAPRAEPSWRAGRDLSDEDLAGVYAHARWVSGLRHVEGFELPVLEGLACGARPVVFDRPDMRQWYDGIATFVPECAGERLVDELERVFRCDPVPMTQEERRDILQRFDWEAAALGFWRAILKGDR